MPVSRQHFGSISAPRLRHRPGQDMAGTKIKVWHTHDAVKLAKEETDRAPLNVAQKGCIPSFVGNISCRFQGHEDAVKGPPGITNESSMSFIWSFSHGGTAHQSLDVQAVHRKPAWRCFYNTNKSALPIPRPITNAAIVAYTTENLDPAKSRLEGFRSLVGVAAPKPFVQTPDMVRLLSLRNSRGFHDHILCAQVGKSSKWVAHPGTYKTRKSGRRVYHFGDLEVLDTEELAWKPTQAKKRLKLGIDEEEPDCCRLPADLDAYNDAKGEHHGLLATFAVARLIAAQQTEAGQADESQALSLLNFDVGTWPTTAHLHRTLLVWSDSKGVLKARSTRKLQGAIHFTTPPSGTSMPPTRPAGVRKTWPEEEIRTLAARATDAAPEFIRKLRRLCSTILFPGEIACRYLAYQTGADTPGIQQRDGCALTFQWRYSCESTSFQELSGELQRTTTVKLAAYHPLVPPLGVVNLAMVSFLLRNLPGKVPWLNGRDAEMVAIATPMALRETPATTWVPGMDGSPGTQYVVCAKRSDTEFFAHPLKKRRKANPNGNCKFRVDHVELIESPGWANRAQKPLALPAPEEQRKGSTRKPDSGLRHVVAFAKFRAATLANQGSDAPIDMGEANMNVDVLSWQARAHSLSVFVIWRQAGAFHCRPAYINKLARACSNG